jgi:hypothetical protein
VFLLPGTLPERRDRTADDAHDAFRESSRKAVSQMTGRQKQNRIKSNKTTIFPSRTRKKSKKSLIFLETDWKIMR